MIDTLYISYRLTKTEYDFLFKSINELSIQLSSKKLFKDRKDTNAYVTYALKKYGYPEIKLRWYKGYVDYRAIEIKIRPKLVIESNNYYELIQPNEIDQFRKIFNELFRNYYLPDILHWDVKRIDYAIDLNISQDLIHIYMLLFKKANLPDFTLNNETTQKYIKSETNLYLFSKNITINYYDRYTTLINKEKELKQEWIDFNVAKNKLRLEVQMKNCKGELIRYLNFNKYKKVLQKKYDLVIGDGNYYLLNESLDIISKRITNIRISVLLRKFIRQIDEAGGIWKAKEKFAQGYVGKDREKVLKEFSRLLNMLRKIGINPVSLKKEYGLVMLPNLKSKINERITEQEQAIGSSYDSMPSILEVGINE